MGMRIHISDAEVARCKARRIEPGASYFITRTCYEGRFFWHPFKHERLMRSRRDGKLHKVDVAPLLRNTQGYLLGLGAQRFNIGIHNYNSMSSHNHQNVQDRCGLLPAFYQWHNSLLARATNRYRGRPSQSVVLSPGSYAATQISCKDSAMDLLAYTAMQPVKHGVVARAEHWPGLRRDNRRLFEGWIYLRDDAFFFRGEADFIKDFAQAPRQQQLAYLEQLAELERAATVARVAAHIKRLPVGTCIGVDPFARDAVSAQATRTDYTPVVLPIAELRDCGPLVVPPHGAGRAVMPAKDDRARPPLTDEATVTLRVPAAAMKDIAKELYRELSGRPLPPAVLLKPEKHPLWADVSDEEYITELDARSAALEEKVNAERERPVRGLRRARLYSWTAQGTRRQRRQRPISKHRDGSERLVDAERIRPNFTARTVGLHRYLTAQLKSFRRRYIAQRRAFAAGERDAVFPFGTYLLLMRFNVACEAPP